MDETKKRASPPPEETSPKSHKKQQTPDDSHEKRDIDKLQRVMELEKIQSTHSKIPVDKHGKPRKGVVAQGMCRYAHC